MKNRCLLIGIRIETSEFLSKRRATQKRRLDLVRECSCECVCLTHFEQFRTFSNSIGPLQNALLLRKTNKNMILFTQVGENLEPLINSNGYTTDGSS